MGAQPLEQLADRGAADEVAAVRRSRADAEHVEHAVDVAVPVAAAVAVRAVPVQAVPPLALARDGDAADRVLEARVAERHVGQARA